MAKIQNRGYDFSPLLIWVRKAHLKSITYALTSPEVGHFFELERIKLIFGAIPCSSTVNLWLSYIQTQCQYAEFGKAVQVTN